MNEVTHPDIRLDTLREVRFDICAQQSEDEVAQQLAVLIERCTLHTLAITGLTEGMLRSGKLSQSVSELPRVFFFCFLPCSFFFFCFCAYLFSPHRFLHNDIFAFGTLTRTGAYVLLHRSSLMHSLRIPMGISST